MFVQSAKFIERHQGNIKDISVYGQDSNPTTWKMAQMNLAIRGIEADLGKFNADTFFDDQHPTLKADFIMANPPFNLSDWGSRQSLQDDVRWKFGIPPSGNANFAMVATHDSSFISQRENRYGIGKWFFIFTDRRGRNDS